MGCKLPTKRQLAEIRRLRGEEGWILARIADRFGRSYTWARHVCIRHGIEPPAHKPKAWRAWTDADRERAIAMRAEGLSASEIGEAIGRTPAAVNQILYRHRKARLERDQMAAANRALAKGAAPDGDEIRTSRRLRGRECGGGDPASATIADHDPPPPNSNAQRFGDVDGIILRRAKFLAGKGWKLLDVARQVRVEPTVLEAALREFARREREEPMA